MAFFMSCHVMVNREGFFISSRHSMFNIIGINPFTGTQVEEKLMIKD
jgi:hypothetical protein